MPDFSSGVSDYITAQATVTVFFPIDNKGYADISCYQCQFFSRHSGICQLNKEVVAYPTRHVGGNCPLEPIKEE